jgi:hypothetical protein
MIAVTKKGHAASSWLIPSLKRAEENGDEERRRRLSK